MPSRVLTQLHLIRHGEVETGGRRLAYGHLDLPLSSLGLEQSRVMVQHVLDKGVVPAGVISSDLGRCRHLGERLAEALGVSLECTESLREQHMGAWEGRSWEDLTAMDPAGVHAYWNDYVNAVPPGGESFGGMVKRVESWWRRCRERIEGGTWIVVTHVGVIRSILCSRLDIPVSEALRYAPARGSYSNLLVAEAGSVLQALGELPLISGRTPLESEPIRALSLAGSAGTGKSTLGQRLATMLDVPFIEEGMRQRIRDGLALDCLKGQQIRDLIEELWEQQLESQERALRAHGGFVADRSPVDFAAFWLHYGFAHDPAGSDEFFSRTVDGL
ncbi:MAG: histidine phosphatase family protein, partial [Myxococcota bacterium]|nr:histidine phosphatase family protein [Myxococcota bacterium]